MFAIELAALYALGWLAYLAGFLVFGFFCVYLYEDMPVDIEFETIANKLRVFSSSRYVLFGVWQGSRWVTCLLLLPYTFWKARRP